MLFFVNSIHLSLERWRSFRQHLQKLVKALTGIFENNYQFNLYGNNFLVNKSRLQNLVTIFKKSQISESLSFLQNTKIFFPYFLFDWKFSKFRTLHLYTANIYYKITQKLRQKCYSLNFTTTDHGTSQIVVLFRETCCSSKCLHPEVVFSWGPWFKCRSRLQQIMVNFTTIFVFFVKSTMVHSIPQSIVEITDGV